MPEDPDYKILRESFAALERSRKRVDAIVDRGICLTLRLSRSPQMRDFDAFLKSPALSEEERSGALSYLKMLVHDDKALT